jgi:hypothetical protein
MPSLLPLEQAKDKIESLVIIGMFPGDDANSKDYRIYNPVTKKMLLVIIFWNYCWDGLLAIVQNIVTNHY